MPLSPLTFHLMASKPRSGHLTHIYEDTCGQVESSSKIQVHLHREQHLHINLNKLRIDERDGTVKSLEGRQTSLAYGVQGPNLC